MPNEKDLNLDINTVADVTSDRPAENIAAEQGPAPSQPAAAPHLQRIQPGEHLDAEQVDTLMGDERAPQMESQQANRALEQAEGLDPEA